MPPCSRPSGCLRSSRTAKRARASSLVSSSHSRPRKPSKVRSTGISGSGRSTPGRIQGFAIAAMLRAAAQHDGLGLGVVLEGLLAVLLAVAAGLPAAERELVVDLRARVDPRVAGL